jgi:hypothetical protein
MAIVRHAAMNLLSRAKPNISFKNRRKRAGWNADYLETVINGEAWPFKRLACIATNSRLLNRIFPEKNGIDRSARLAPSKNR